MIIKWSDDAKQDLKLLRQYIKQENPSAANRIANCIRKAIDLLVEQPGMGRQGRKHGTRELVVLGTYIIPYQVKNKSIVIVRVFHHAMQWSEEV
jgi:addiction module RelE/StbE family toxin